MAHPLLDRRDLTAARERAPVGERPPAASLDEGALAHELRTLNGYLCALLDQERADIAQLCVTDREPAQAAMRHFPTPGAKREIVRRTGNGGVVTLAPAAVVPILKPNEARLGGVIVNSGTADTVLYLTSDLLTPGGGAPLGEGVPQISLGAGGGSWDLRLAGLLWCGTIIAVSQSGSTLTVAEV